MQIIKQSICTCIEFAKTALLIGTIIIFAIESRCAYGVLMKLCRKKCAKEAAFEVVDGLWLACEELKRTYIDGKL